MSDTRYPEASRIIDPLLRRLLERMALDLDEMRGIRNQLDAAPQIAADGEVRTFEAGVIDATGGQYRYTDGAWVATGIDQTARDSADAAQTAADSAAADATTALAAAADGTTALGLVDETTGTDAVYLCDLTTCGEVEKTGASYPPTGAASYTSTGAGSSAATKKNVTGGTYTNRVIVLRFDTSGIPNGATIVRAWLLFPPSASALIGTADNRNLEAEYRSNAFSTADYTDAITTANAISFKQSHLAGNTPGHYAMPLLNVGNINKTGNTDLRLAISGGAPSNNQNTFALLNDNRCTIMALCR